MNKNFKIKALDMNSVIKIQEFYDNKKIQLKHSIISLFQWKSYTIEIFYYFDKEDYFFFTKNKKENTYNGLIIFLIYNLKMFYFEKFLLILSNLNTKYFIYSEELPIEFTNKFNLKINNKLDFWISNYFYKIEKFKGFPGKAMQKKRNHLNYFLKTFPNHKIFQINEINLNTAKKFVKKNTTNFENEWKSYLHIFENFFILKKWIKGSILYVGDEIIGVTIGIINNNIYEILIEKALKNFRGSFQFLLSENLKLNDINVEYVDRQDDLMSENLIKSKDSYNPDKKLVLFCYKN